jgi:tRNA nucleotidyltransferase (CCA-adding enzyme)
MQESCFVKNIKQAGGRVFIVGGWVRDSLMGRVPKDKDYVICGLTEKNFIQIFPKAQKVGKTFPVYILKIDEKTCEIAFARKERKNGSGYKGFVVEYNENISIEDDLFRRDTTMNSIAMELPERRLLDPLDGRQDIYHKRIRASSRHFIEDPVRALRAARQAAELHFAIMPDTLRFMERCGHELIMEPQARIFHEMEGALASKHPSLFFRNLQKADLLADVFPEIYALIGKKQPLEFHPEGDAFEHSMNILDVVSESTAMLSIRFAALTHDIGKGGTPKAIEPHHYGHEKRGDAILMKWNARCTLPKVWLQSARFIIREHMRAPLLEKPGKIVELLLAIHHTKIGFDNFNHIILADHGSLPVYLREYERFLTAVLSISGKDCPEGLRGSMIGKWIREQQIKAYLQAKAL